MTTVEAEARADVSLAELSSEIRITNTPRLTPIFKLTTTLMTVEGLSVTGSSRLFPALAPLQQPTLSAQTLVGQVVLILWN